MDKQTVPYLKFKYILNHQISLQDDQQYAIPSRMGEAETPKGRAVIPIFDMDFEHKVLLKDETPRIPKEKPANMSKAYFEKICDKAYEAAGTAKEFNDKVRTEIQHYVNVGVIRVVEDPFALETTLDGFDPSTMSTTVEDAVSPTTAVDKTDGRKKATSKE